MTSLRIRGGDPAGFSLNRKINTMNTAQKRFWPILLLALLSLVASKRADTAPTGGLPAHAGPYQLEVRTDPNPIPLGPAKVRIHVTDSAGKDVAGAQVQVLTQMPGMAMGERPEPAMPEPGQPGVYSAPANFRMAGGWGINVQVDGPQGSGKAALSVNTGQNTLGAGGAANGLPILGTLLGLGLVGFILFRMRVTGQRVNLGAVLRPGVIVGVLLLVAVYGISVWAVQKFQKPGHMSVLEAQGMDMSVMKPPVGAVPVAAMAAKRQSIDSTVSYTGSAVSFVDQEVYPRVTGWITWMPFYPGDRVRKGQLLAKLDSRELSSKVNEQVAARTMAEHEHMIAGIQYQQALGTAAQARARVTEARNDLAGARSELAGARQELAAANEDQASAQADFESAQTGLPDAQAQLAAAQADQEYWTAQLQRSQALLKSGAISLEEYQKDRASAEDASSKVQQAQARIAQVKAAIRGAQSRINRSQAMVAAARDKVAGMAAKVQSSQAKIEQELAGARAMTAAAEAAQHEIPHSEAGAQQAAAAVNTAEVVKGYTEIRSQVDGVVTQRLISPGVLVNPGQAILAVSQIHPIRLQANVAESDLQNIRVGSTVRVRNMKDPKRVVEARVTSIFPAIDPTARTAIVEALSPNTESRFLPGEYLTMDITTGESKDALVVPAGAIVWQPEASSAVLGTNETPAVWVITNGQPEKTIYTCTMHPDVKQDKPGKCPT
jgi:RND family efflux transporter MFP subunit